MSETEKPEDELPDLLSPCLICGKQPDTVGGFGSQALGADGKVGFFEMPYGATMFTTHGHYGSTFWDSFTGERIHAIVCDPCLRERVARLRFTRPVKSYPEMRQAFTPKHLAEPKP